MAGALNRSARRLLPWLAVLAGGAGAQVLNDPTRPPAGLEAVLAGEAVAARPAASGLTSILRRAQGKPAAVIDGQFVELGGKVREATLVGIDQDRVTLRSGEGDEVLLLTPGIEKVVGDREKQR